MSWTNATVRRQAVPRRDLQTTSIIETVPMHRRPFRPAVDAHHNTRPIVRALSVWDQFVIAMINAVTTTWHNGTSIDPYDGDVHLLVRTGVPLVEISTNAPIITPDPMHLRGAVHLIEGRRPAMRREATLNSHTLDAIIATELHAAVRKYPMTLERPGDAAALNRLKNRYAEATPTNLRYAG